MGADVVRVRVNILCIRVVVLHCDINKSALALTENVNYLRVDNVFFPVEVLNVLDDAALIVKNVFYRLFAAVVFEIDSDALVEESHLAETRKKKVIIKNDLLKNSRIRFKCRCRSRFIRIAYNLKRAGSFSAFVTLIIDVTIPADLDFKVLGKCIDYGSADAVKTAGNRVSFSSKLTACVKHRMNDLNSRNSEFFVNTYRNAGSVI